MALKDIDETLHRFRFYFFSREEPRIHVHAQSAEGEAKFWLEPAIELAVSYNLKDKDLTMNPSPHPLVVLIEDDLRLAELIRSYLESNGFRVVVEHRGDRGIERVRAENPDLVVLDVGLPGRDGFSVCRELRSGGAIPILMLTARDSDIDHVLGLELGADDYVIKPVEPRVLVARIQALLRRGRNSVLARLTADPELAFRLSYLDYALALAQLRQGRSEFGREVVRKHGAVSPRSLDDLILLTAGLGMPREAIENLEASHFYRNYRYLATEPGLKPLYGDPGFRKLLEETYQEWNGMLADVGDSLPVQPPVLPAPKELLAVSVKPAS